MAEKYKHYFVPQSLVKNWSKDGKHASWYEPMTQKSIPNGGIGRYFHSNLIDLSEGEKETLLRINLFFENLIRNFLNGETEWLKSDTLIPAREVLLFQILQSPKGPFSPDKLLSMFALSLDLFLKSPSKKEMEERERTENVKEALSQMLIFGINLLDMEAVILEAEDNSSFVLGSFPITLINPYFSLLEHEKYLDSQPFDFYGSTIVLPLSPEKAICIYDPDTYTPVEKNGSAKLTKDDIDMLNSAMLYNSGEAGGVIHVCPPAYINELYNKLDENDFFRDTYLGCNLDEYPFPTKLSVLKVKREAEKKLKERQKNSIRPFVRAIIEYDDKHLEKVKEKDYIKAITKRYKEAEKILSSRGKEKE